jgi:hypothetical protein
LKGTVLLLQIRSILEPKKSVDRFQKEAVRRRLLFAIEFVRAKLWDDRSRKHKIEKERE